MHQVPVVASEDEAHLNLFLKYLSHEAIARTHHMTPKQSKYRLSRITKMFAVKGRNGLLSLIVSKGITFQNASGVIKTIKLSITEGSDMPSDPIHHL